MSDEPEDLVGPPTISKYREKIVSESIVRTFLWLGFPPLINQLIVVAYNVADAFWLSSYSDVAVAVPRQMWPVIMLFQSLLLALMAACLSIVSQNIGRKAYDDASVAASRFLTLSFVTGAVLSFSLFLLRSLIFTWVVSTPSEIFEDLMKYSGIIALDIFFNYLSFTYTTLLQSIGDTRKPAIVNGIAVCINIVLDPFLVLGIGPFPRLGVVGAALTDVMGKIIAVVALAYIFRRNYPDLKVRFTKRIDAKWVRLVLRIGLPVLSLGLMNGFAFLMQLRIVNALGIVAATAFSIGFVVLDIVDAALWGLSGATSIMVGQSLGADDRRRAKEVAYKSALLIFTIMVVAASIIYPFRRELADVFADELNIIGEVDLFLQMLLPTLPFFGLFIVGMSTGRGSGHTLFPTTVGILRLWGIRLALGYFLVFTFGYGSMGAWLAISLSNVAGGVASLLWIKYGNWAVPVIKKKHTQASFSVRLVFRKYSSERPFRGKLFSEG
ncbi:MAG: MATE family efflux transporter [Candidatus Bathyarchaeia archaeon]